MSFIFPKWSAQKLSLRLAIEPGTTTLLDHTLLLGVSSRALSPILFAFIFALRPNCTISSFAT